MNPDESLHPGFTKNEYLFRRKLFKIFGAAFHIYDRNGELCFYSKQKAFKLREDFRVYKDETEAEEMLIIKTPQILDIGATYYVADATNGQSVGALRRKALKSIIKDEWAILGKDNEEIGVMGEAGWAGALLSRTIKLIPQSYVISDSSGKAISHIKGSWNPFVHKFVMTITQAEPAIDRRLLIAAGIMLVGIEGRQQ